MPRSVPAGTAISRASASVSSAYPDFAVYPLAAPLYDAKGEPARRA
ncbi:hypothetical protein ACVBGC_00940 [Burkholderia stagnalis]